MKSQQEANKALVIEAFDTLFNKRDYAGAEQFWSPNYIQHSAHIGPGREGLFNLIKGAPSALKYERTLEREGMSASPPKSGHAQCRRQCLQGAKNGSLGAPCREGALSR